MTRGLSSRLQSVEQFAAGSIFTEPQLRWYIAKAHDNGFAKHKVVVRVGRRVYIDPEAFDLWIEAQNAGARYAQDE